MAERLLRDPVAADDAAQGTWAQVLQRGPNGAPSRSELWRGLRAWIKEDRRGSRRRIRREASAASMRASTGVASSTAELAAQQEQFHRVWDGLIALDDPLRSTLLMHFQGGLSPSAIAAQTGTPVDTVRWRIRRGVADLRARLASDRAAGGLGALAILGVPTQPSVSAVGLGAGASSLLIGSMSKLLVASAVALAVALALLLRPPVPSASPSLDAVPIASVGGEGGSVAEPGQVQPLVDPEQPMANPRQVAASGQAEVADSPKDEALQGGALAGWALRARVVDRAGRALRGVTVFPERAVALRSRIELGEGQNDWRVSGEDGWVAWTNLDWESRKFLIHSDQHRDRVVSLVDFQRELSGTGAVRWVLEDGVAARGRLLGVPLDAPPRLKVMAAIQSSQANADCRGGHSFGFFSLVSWAPVADDGTFALGGLHPGATYAVRVLRMRSNVSNSLQALHGNPAETLCERTEFVADGSDVSLQWLARATLRLRVVDHETGDVVAGPVLRSRTVGLAGAVRSGEPHTLDGNGSIVIADLPPIDGEAEIVVGAPGYNGEVVRLPAIAPGERLDAGSIALVAMGHVDVRVVDAESGRGVPGAEVYASDRMRGAGRLGPRAAVVMTDADGNASVPFRGEIPGGFSVRHPEYAERVHVEDEASEDRAVTIRVNRGGEVRVQTGPGVQVRALPVAGDAHAGAKMRRANRKRDLRVREAVANPKGVATFTLLPAGKYDFVAAADRRPDAGLLSQALRLHDVGAGPGTGAVRASVAVDETVRVDLASAMTATLNGVVLLEGQPLAGARVALFDPLQHVGGSLRLMLLEGDVVFAVTDAAGRFSVTSGAAETMTVVVQSERCALPYEARLDLSDGDRTLDLDVTGGSIEGRVCDADGVPLRNQGVRVVVPRRDATEVSVITQTDLRTHTDSNGRFRLAGLPFGQRFTVKTRTRGWSTASSGVLTLEARGEPIDLQLVVQPVAEGR